MADPVRVIVVDDYPPILEMMCTVLKTIGCDIVGTAENGELGVALYKDTHPDIVFLDIEMPAMNGLDALRGIMKTDPEANVVMLTNVDDTTVAENCITVGARDYVQKQSDPTDLVKKLMDLTKKLRAPT